MESSDKGERVWGREGSYNDVMISVLEPNTDVYTITLRGQGDLHAWEIAPKPELRQDHLGLCGEITVDNPSPNSSHLVQS